MSHYTEAFCTTLGRCFRFSHSGVGHAAHFREPVVRSGRFVDAKGERWTVDACADTPETSPTPLSVVGPQESPKQGKQP
jgi:hypothetical protein